ncbi:MAG: hypothetical protein COA78_21170 [Blastopirellula sp.]|nr:MAG: hypothetical protein COA78_21170 [Blastopirellula sp.]
MGDSIKLEIYIRVARVKITTLIKREDFLCIIDSTDQNITLEFESDRCTVNKWGRVDWISDDND